MIESLRQRLILSFKYTTLFTKKNLIPLKWKILFLKSLFWRKSYFCIKFYNLLQDYNKGDHYNFNGLKVSFFSFKSNERRLFAKFLVEAFLIIIFPVIYGAEFAHPLVYKESYYIDNKKMNINPTDIVIDCGGFIGHFSIGASKLANKGKIFVFEPFQENISLLMKNINQNNLNNITLIQKAVSEKNKKMELFFNTGSPCSSGKFSKASSNIAYTIQSTSIDEFFKNNNLKRVDFIKMDIEGMERYALMGAKGVIKKFKPKLSICTYHLKDDKIVLPRIIKNIRRDYMIEKKVGKIFAY